MCIRDSRVSDPERYGVAEFDEQGNCLSIEEKPQHPKSKYAVYVYKRQALYRDLQELSSETLERPPGSQMCIRDRLSTS